MALVAAQVGQAARRAAGPRRWRCRRCRRGRRRPRRASRAAARAPSPHCRRSRCRPAAAASQARCSMRAVGPLGSRRRARARRHRTTARAPARRVNSSRAGARGRGLAAPPSARRRCAAAARACAARCGRGRESRRAARTAGRGAAAARPAPARWPRCRPATRCGAAVPWALAWMSLAKRSALSSCTPAARCTRVPAAGNEAGGQRGRALRPRVALQQHAVDAGIAQRERGRQAAGAGADDGHRHRAARRRGGMRSARTDARSAVSRQAVGRCRYSPRGLPITWPSS